MKLQRYLRVVGVGITSGWIGGSVMFVSTKPDVMAFKGFATYPTVFVLIAGVFAYLLTESLVESIYAITICFLSGMAVMMIGQIAPLYILGYDQASRSTLMLPFLAQVVTVGITKYLYYLVIGYMLAIGGTYAVDRWKSPV